ncbi:MAG TPA: hypothetical protein VG777_00685, partial [Thermoanaerobaculia bacterium]|nr:hypothetical protein [Thermoanaerobaculia bacterium]
MSSWWFRSAVAAMFFAAAAVRAQAPGDLDPTFGSGGKVTTDFGGSSDELFALAQQPDGMIVGAGSGSVDCVSTEPTTCSPPPAGFSLARYALDGSLDPAFGAGGLVLGAGEAHAVYVLGDGAILAAGTECDASVASGCELQVARYLSDGTLDATFGS